MLWQVGEYRSCTTPRLVRDVGPVACGQCVNCGKSRVKDWVGRNLLEAETAHYSLFCTLTIGGDRIFEPGLATNPKAQHFHKDDVNAYLKRMRRYIEYEWLQAGRSESAALAYLTHHGLPVIGSALASFPKEKPRVRYFLVGQNGDANGRVHYHLLMHFYGCKGPADLEVGRFMFHGKYPDGVVVGARIVEAGGPRWGQGHLGVSMPVDGYATLPIAPRGIDWVKSDRTYWPFGMVQYREFVPDFAYYVTSYVSRELGPAQVMRPGISKAPLLGAYEIKRQAKMYVEQQLSPQSRTYMLPSDLDYVQRRKAARNKVSASSSGFFNPDGQAVPRSFMPEFWLSEAAYRLLCREFVSQWRAAYAADPVHRPEHWPASEMIDEYLARVDDEKARKADILAGRPHVHDQVDLDMSEVRVYEQGRRRAMEPIDLSEVGRIAARRFGREGDGQASADFDRNRAPPDWMWSDGHGGPVSRAAASKMANASESERARLVRRQENRYRKLQTGE